MQDASLPCGKLKLDLLEELLSRYSSRDDRVRVGAQIGEDAAAIDMGSSYLIAKTDPITFVTEDIGFYAVTINANDIATMGAAPKWFLVTLLLPEGKTTPEMVESIFSQIAQGCHKFNISLCGGHTEITGGIDRPIVIGQMLGEVEKDKLVTTSGARIGDVVILTKGIAIEATSILARTKREEIARERSPEFADRCANFLYAPGISIVKEALLAAQTGLVHSMHDPTEGGLATGLHEMARAAGVGMRIWRDKIPVLPEADILCNRYHLDILGVIASGALLICAASPDAEKIISRLKSEGVEASIIGSVTHQSDGIKIYEDGKWRDLPSFERDEITKIFQQPETS